MPWRGNRIIFRRSLWLNQQILLRLCSRRHLSRSSKGSLLHEFHIPPHYNFPALRNVDMVSICILAVSYQIPLFCSHVQLLSLFIGYMTISRTAKDPKVTYFRLAASEDTFWHDISQCIVRNSFLKVDIYITSFSPQKFGHVLIIQYCPCSLDNGSIFPLCHTILLRIIWSGPLSFDTFPCAEPCEFIVRVLSTIV